MDSPDLNLWLALAWGGHRHHATAYRCWEEQAADSVVFTTVTALGLVRLLSQPSGVLAAFLEPPGVRLVDEAAASWPVFRQLLSSGIWPARFCTDVHMAALTIAEGWRLVSFDRDFGRFSGLS